VDILQADSLGQNLDPQPVRVGAGLQASANFLLDGASGCGQDFARFGGRTGIARGAGDEQRQLGDHLTNASFSQRAEHRFRLNNAK
jgi:hypothetical protein